MSPSPPESMEPNPKAAANAPLLAGIFEHVAHAVDGARLVRAALAAEPPSGVAPAVLALGKVAFPMFDGFVAACAGRAPGRGLVIAPATRFPANVTLPPGVDALVADHPEPTPRSVEAGSRARAFVASLRPEERLVVLLSGGGSSLAVDPLAPLSLDDKRAITRGVARGGATIGELNAVRKHLSAIKGGRLALATTTTTTVLALSDVVGSDPGTIASGPFSADASTFADARALVARFAPDAPAAAKALLDRGVAGGLPETPKAGDQRLAHVRYDVIAGPERVPEEARQAVVALGHTPGVLSRNTEASVEDLARSYGERARIEHASAGATRVLVGNGEPSIVVRGHGRGGRATHLALLMAREIDGLEGVSFLAAGTDDRDGSANASGAFVDGSTWQRARAAGLDPEGALVRCDSETPLAALGCLVRGPGTSNLLDLHLLGIQAAPRTTTSTNLPG